MCYTVYFWTVFFFILRNFYSGLHRTYVPNPSLISDCGGGVLGGFGVRRSKEKIKMNVWNTVNLERANRKGEISVNDRDQVRGESPVRRRA